YAPGEQLAAHSRQRFRLLPPKVQTQAAPQVDPSLWIVHYGPSDKRIPINMIPYDVRMQNILNSRAYLLKFGQIIRKEFMLSDRQNWPQLPFPPGGNRQPGYGPPGVVRQVPQQMAYPPHAPAPGAPPSKRARHAAAAQNQHPPVVGAMAQIDTVCDDEEDT